MNLINIIGKIKSFVFNGPKVQSKGSSFMGSSWERASGWNITKYMQAYERSLYVHACISKIAENTSAIELELFNILNSKGDTEQVYFHPVLDLLYRPNPFQTKTEFWKIADINLKSSGNCFWLKIRNESGQVVELWNLRPDRMTIVGSEESFISHYEFNTPNGRVALIPPDDIIHFKEPTPLDEYLGVSVLKPAAKRVDSEDFSASYQRDFFLNNARPDALLKFPYNLKPHQKAEIKDNWEDRHRGIGASSRFGVLEGGLEYQQVSLTQKEMDYIESMKFLRDDILVAFQVPKPIIAVTDDVNRANAETAMFIFLSQTIKPEMGYFVEKLNQQLIIPDYDDSLVLGFVDPTPENEELKIKQFESGLANNYLLINEVRNKLGFPEVTGGWSWYNQLSQIPGGGISKENRKSLVVKSPLNIFRGRAMLRIKLAIKESLIEGVKTDVKKTLKIINGKLKLINKKAVKKTKKKELVPVMKGEIREKYATLILKVLDRQENQFKAGVLLEAKKQEKRVMENLREVASSKGLVSKFGRLSKKKIEVDVKEIFDIKKENNIFAKFAFPLIEEYVKEAGDKSLNFLAPQEDFNLTEDQTAKFIKDRSKFFADSVNSTTFDKLTKTIEEGVAEGEGILKISDRIGKVYKQYPDSRADLMARTEVTSANNRGFMDSYKQSGVANHKEWIATMDDKTRPEHVKLDGEIVKLDEKFSNGLEYPSEPNCRCVIGPVIEN